MKRTTTSSPIFPKKLTSSKRAKLVDQLYQVHAQIFDGVDKEAFRKYVIEPDTILTKLYLFKNDAQEIVGYLTFQVFQTEISSPNRARRPYIFRTETGILKPYRGGSPVPKLLFWNCLKFCIARGLPEAYFLATPIHPLPYFLTERNVGELYPRPNLETPPHILEIIDKISGALGLIPAKKNNPYVKQVGWIVRQDNAQLQRLKQSQSPAIQFYLHTNPEFEKGTGMMMIAPAVLPNAFSSAWKMLKMRFKRKKKARTSEKAFFVSQPN